MATAVAELRSDVRPVRYGPTGVPERTLGWTALDWCTENLLDFEGGAFEFTREQALFVLWWYAVDTRGRWLSRRGVLRRMKGWGKDPLAAILAVYEWIGPCRFGGWEDEVTPVGVPEHASWIQIAAATALQAEQNTMSVIPTIIPESLRIEEQLTIGIKVCWAPGRRRIQAVSNSSKGLEGARATFIIMGETQHLVASNGGIDLAAVCRRNLAKSPGGRARSLAITNAHRAGDGSVAETDWDARDTRDLLYDSVEAPAHLDPMNREHVVAGIECARGDSSWLDVERIADDWMDPAADLAQNKRFFWNQVVAGEGRWMDPAAWAASERDETPPKDGAYVTLGFDGSRFRDATALVGTDLETGWQWIVGLWERDWADPHWEVDIREVNALIDEVRERWMVTRFYADPTWWEESVSRWTAAFVRPDERPAVAAWYTGGARLIQMARTVRAYHRAVDDQSCTHEVNPAFTRHMLAAFREPLRGRAGEDGLWVIRKASRASTDSIDAAMAALLSWQACLDSRADGDLELATHRPVRVRLPRSMRESR